MTNSSPLQSPFFAVTIRQGIAVIRPHEPIFMNREAGEFEGLLGRVREQGYTRLVVDLSDCEYISSEGLGVTARCWAWCHDEGKGHMALVLPHDTQSEVRHLFEITGILRTIGSALQPCLHDALNYLKEFSE